MTGILEKIINNFEQKSIYNGGKIKLEYIVEFIRDLQNHEYDAHICVMGQNGNGKSYLMLSLMKLLDAESLKTDRIVFAYDKTSKLINLLKESKNSVIGIDEGKKFFNYKQSMTTEQIVLQNMIEYARENKNAFVVCVNDIRRLNNNYRNAKVQVVIWLLDRYDEETQKEKAYGLVFIGNPALEEEDKFKMDIFQNLQSFESIRLMAESSPTLYGYLFIEDIKYIISQEELQRYKENKKKGIQTAAQDYIAKLERKENVSNQQLENTSLISKLLANKKIFK